MTAGDRHERPVRVHTTVGVFDGALLVSTGLRTLDDLNVVARNFVTIHRPTAEGRPVGETPLSINKASILFLAELGAPPRRSGDFGSFSQAALLLRVGSYRIRGHVHVPPGGEPLKRLDQSSHPFLALTSVLLVGAEGEWTTPFLALNRGHVAAAQSLPRAAPNEPGQPVTRERAGSIP